MLRILTLALALLPALLPAQTASTPKVVTGTVLLNDRTAPNFKKLLATLPSDWLVRTDSVNVTDKTAVFSTPGATVMLAWLDYPVPPDEVQVSARISWLWKNAEVEATKSQAQLVISVLGDPKNTVDLYRIFTRVTAASLTQIPSAPGVFMNSEYLVLSRGYYTEVARNMGTQDVPLYLWAYFGLLQNEGKSGCYTYGLSEFGLLEMELVDSPLGLQDAHALIFEAAQTAVRKGEQWRDGQSVELSDGQKITVGVSDAKYIGDGGKTLKIN
jgi:Tfp pilus assembly protein PilX